LAYTLQFSYLFREKKSERTCRSWQLNSKSKIRGKKVSLFSQQSQLKGVTDYFFFKQDMKIQIKLNLLTAFPINQG
jgi:hypothetical protein